MDDSDGRENEQLDEDQPLLEEWEAGRYSNSITCLLGSQISHHKRTEDPKENKTSSQELNRPVGEKVRCQPRPTHLMDGTCYIRTSNPMGSKKTEF